MKIIVLSLTTGGNRVTLYPTKTSHRIAFAGSAIPEPQGWLALSVEIVLEIHSHGKTHVSETFRNPRVLEKDQHGFCVGGTCQSTPFGELLE